MESASSSLLLMLIVFDCAGWDYVFKRAVFKKFI